MTIKAERQSFLRLMYHRSDQNFSCQETMKAVLDSQTGKSTLLSTPKAPLRFSNKTVSCSFTGNYTVGKIGEDEYEHDQSYYCIDIRDRNRGWCVFCHTGSIFDLFFSRLGIFQRRAPDFTDRGPGAQLLRAQQRDA